jgi:hypothetical protein
VFPAPTFEFDLDFLLDVGFQLFQKIFILNSQFLGQGASEEGVACSRNSGRRNDILVSVLGPRL